MKGTFSGKPAFPFSFLPPISLGVNSEKKEKSSKFLPLRVYPISKVKKNLSTKATGSHENYLSL